MEEQKSGSVVDQSSAGAGNGAAGLGGQAAAGSMAAMGAVRSVQDAEPDDEMEGGGGGLGPNGVPLSVQHGPGPLLKHVQVQVIFWGTAWSGPLAALRNQVGQAVHEIMTGPYLAGLAEYGGIGPGAIHGTTVTQSDPANVFTDADVTGLIQGLMDAGHVPAPGAVPEMVYLVIAPPGAVSIHMQSAGWHGAHSFAFHGQEYYYAWVTSVPGTVDDYSWIISHEIAEACTDPDTRSITLTPLPPGYQGAYEVGDPCEWRSNLVRVNGVLVQEYWSDKHGGCWVQTTQPTPSTPTWARLGGQVKGGMAVASNQDGRLEVFVRSPAGGVYHRFQTQPNKGWNPQFQPLGGQIQGRIVALRNSDGRLAVFARGTDGALWHNFQVQPNQGWNGWTAMDANPVPIDDLFVGKANADGRLALLARRADGVLLHRAQQGVGGGWDAWAPLDQTVQVVGGLAVGRNSDGRLEIFARDGQGTVQHIWQQHAGGAWTGWSSLGGNIGGLLAVGQNGDGRLEVFARGIDGAIWHRWQSQPGDSQHWSQNWASLGGSINDVSSVVSNHDGRLEVFGRGGQNALSHIWQTQANNGWVSGWGSLGGNVSDLLAVGSNGDGRLEVFVQGADGAVWHIWQTSPGGAWNT